MAPLIYDLTIPTYVRALQQLSAVLKKGEDWADENGVAHEKLLQAQLAPDMFKLPFQVMQACRTARNPVGELPGPPFDFLKITTLAELQDLIKRTLDLLADVKPETWEGKENSELKLDSRDEDYYPKMIPYMQSFGFPNFFFHVTTAYAILRSQGVPVGKADFLGPRQHIFVARPKQPKTE